MSRELSLDDIVTEFLLNTCRPCPRYTGKHTVWAEVLCGLIVTPDEVDNELIPLTTGSVAEFYIEPILPHLGDIDVMYHFNTELAIQRGHPPPTQLPAEFHNYVKVREIIDSHLPGYVYLELRYLLTECSDGDKYNAVEYDTGKYRSHPAYSDKDNIHGPALLASSDNESLMLSVDHVPCVRCLSWPSQAADWPTRHRNYGWPDSATLDRVVSNGCDVVGVAHLHCREHKWMGKYQWRLSFSRAEIVLINSWMPVQQIIYHMLRYFTKKTERLTDCAFNIGAGKPSNYHIKTLMLWACELKSTSWWTDDVNLVRICVQLLHVLAKWLNDRRCKHHFINNCNLIDNSFNGTNIRDQLMSIDETWLSMWFADYYIRACLQLNDCPQNISRLFDDVTTRTKLQNAVSALVDWKRNSSVLDLWRTFNTVQFTVTPLYSEPLTARSCVCWMTELTKIDSCLSVYFTAVAFLHVASRSLRHGFNDELMDILAAVCGQFTDTLRGPNKSTSTSVLSLKKAAKLMRVVANKSLSTMSLVEIELSKAYLYRALSCKDYDSDSIYCLANVYLAVLYYTTGQHQTAIDHCALVTRSQDHSQCSLHVVQGDILPKIDDDVDNMLGLAELYQSLRTAALKQQRQPQFVSSVFTTELFAHYLTVTECDRFMQRSLTDEFKRYEICMSDTQQLFIRDVLLFLSVRQLLKCRQKPIFLTPQHPLMNTNKCNSSDLVELLQTSAVEHLTTCRQLEVRDFGSVVTIVTTDFEAVYAFKRGDYQRCLQLSTQNVHTLWYADVNMKDVTILPFIQLFDDDIVSLTALTLMVNPQCRDVDADYIPYTVITQLTLSLYLMIQCQLKLHHSLTSLAQTLDYIKVARRRYSADGTLNQLTLKLIERKLVACVQ